MAWRNKYKARGRPKKMFRKSDDRKHHSLGGIPMEIKDGKIVYAQQVRDEYSIKKERGGEIIYFDSESEERRDATLPTGEGSFIRRHIYEMQFEIDDEGETDEERRKREYKEWWEEQ